MATTWTYPTPDVPAPQPTQGRAEQTVHDALRATTELLDRLPEPEVTLELIRRRSGVSQGSLAHHFGGRAGLVAAAQVQRYARTCAADAAFMADLVASLPDTSRFSDAILSALGNHCTPERRRVRWIRLSAIAAAVDDIELSETLRAAAAPLLTVHLTLAQGLREQGILRPGIDPRSVATIFSAHGQGLVLDELAGTDVPAPGWERIQARFIAGTLSDDAAEHLMERSEARTGDLWRAEVFGDPSRVPDDVQGRLSRLRRDVGDRTMAAEDATDPERVERLLRAAADGGSGVDAGARAQDARQALVRAASERIRRRGARALDLGELRSSTGGITPQMFHRLVGTREELVRAARIHLEIRRAVDATTRVATLLAFARDRSDIRRAVDEECRRLAGPEQRRALGQRMETLAATRTDPILAAALSGVQQTARDLLVEQVALARGRDLIEAELAPRAVARFLDLAVLWHVFQGVELLAPAPDAWAATFSTLGTLLAPGR